MKFNPPNWDERIGRTTAQQVAAPTADPSSVGIPDILDQLQVSRAGDPAGVRDVMPTVNAYQFGDISILPIACGLAMALILPRSPTQRIFLFIQNQSAVNTITVNFGSNTANGLQLGPGTPGQALFFDVFVPQNEIYIAATAAPTTAILAYSNKV